MHRHHHHHYAEEPLDGNIPDPTPAPTSSDADGEEPHGEQGYSVEQQEAIARTYKELQDGETFEEQQDGETFDEDLARVLAELVRLGTSLPVTETSNPLDGTLALPLGGGLLVPSSGFDVSVTGRFVPSRQRATLS